MPTVSPTSFLNLKSVLGLQTKLATFLTFSFAVVTVFPHKGMPPHSTANQASQNVRAKWDVSANCASCHLVRLQDTPTS